MEDITSHIAHDTSSRIIDVYMYIIRSIYYLYTFKGYILHIVDLYMIELHHTYAYMEDITSHITHHTCFITHDRCIHVHCKEYILPIHFEGVHITYNRFIHDGYYLTWLRTQSHEVLIPHMTQSPDDSESWGINTSHDSESWWLRVMRYYYLTWLRVPITQSHVNITSHDSESHGWHPYPRLGRKVRILVRTRGYLRSWQGNQAPVPDFKVLPIYPRYTLLAWIMNRSLWRI